MKIKTLTLFFLLVNTCTMFVHAQNESLEIISLTKQLLKSPHNANLYFQRAEEYMDLDLYEKAITDYNEVIKLTPLRIEAYLRCSEAMLESEDYDMARLTISLAIKNLPKEAELYAFRADIEASIDNYKEALADYTLALTIKPNDYDYLRARAWTYVGLMQYNKALADYKLLFPLTTDDNKCAFYGERGEIYLKANMHKEAIADFTQALSLPNAKASKDNQDVVSNDSYYHQRGLAYFALQDYTKAIADFTQAIKLDAQEAEYYTCRSEAYEKIGKEAEAKKDKRIAQRISSEINL
ncbi:MAG: tetratricopeptide repeat protein [Bacteroidales bacterium]